MLCSILLSLALAAADTVTIPAGTGLSLRLITAIGSKTSKANDPVEAVVIAPVLAGGRTVKLQGVKLTGKVKQVQPVSASAPRAVLALEFSELVSADGKKIKTPVQVVHVDNARELVDPEGRINGILGSETISGRMDQGIQKVAERYAGLAGLLQAAKGGVVKQSDPEIDYPAGVELEARVTRDFQCDFTGSVAAPGPVTPEADLSQLVNALPFQTMAENPPKPSDITNLMFIGSEQAIAAAFKAAGWFTAAQLSPESKFATLRAIAESRGYKEAPMSTLLLEGHKPDLTFEKQNNTFAKRHHLRVWRRAEQFGGKAVWVVAATHDTGIQFSQENRTFIHKIDGKIDSERAKVVYDLIFTGQVKGDSVVARPAVPTSGMNATGDTIETDGAMAVLAFE